MPLFVTIHPERCVPANTLAGKFIVYVKAFNPGKVNYGTLALVGNHLTGDRSSAAPGIKYGSRAVHK